MYNRTRVCEQAVKIRLDIITMLAAAGSGHPGGSLSAADIVATLYFGDVLNFDAKNPQDPARDRFVLCKGHAAPVLYAALAQAGYFDKKELLNLRKLGAMLQGHPDALKTPGVEVSTGSLGQGLSIACGMAAALKAAGGPQRVFTLLGDGELQEGQVWEAALFAPHYRLDNLVAIIDSNGLQIDGACCDVMALGDIAGKFRAFGWDACEVDGHDIDALHAVLSAAPCADKPRAIIAHTEKGKGVSFMEGVASWHGVTPCEKQAREACAEIECAGNEARDRARDSVSSEGGHHG
ncbi:MAG: transketolase [Coriobacteriia bacterium]|nr:transketolase [Coriobacteriia bacterium]